MKKDTVINLYKEDLNRASVGRIPEEITWNDFPLTKEEIREASMIIYHYGPFKKILKSRGDSEEMIPEEIRGKLSTLQVPAEDDTKKEYTLQNMAHAYSWGNLDGKYKKGGVEGWHGYLKVIKP